MKSVKPGRGPSAMGAAGAVIAVVFGIFWTAMASSMGAPGFFPAFGVLFIIMGIVQAVYHFKNATGENRYSAFDITEDGEEPDPLEERFSARRAPDAPQSSDAADCEDAAQGAAFCPYCGAQTETDYAFCRRCGKRLS